MEFKFTDHAYVTEDGRVFRKRDDKEYPQNLNKQGYFRVSLYNPETKSSVVFLVHRLVAATYCDNPDNEQIVNHIDGNKRNNHKSNLEWISLSENTQHALELGLRSFTPRKGGKRDWRGRFNG